MRNLAKRRKRWSNLLETAEVLAEAGTGKPRQSNLRRAVSTIYYALFHCLANCCADMFIGTAGAQRNDEAWLHVYRALDHGSARNRCENSKSIQQLPQEIRNFAAEFCSLQEKRHAADYDPTAVYHKLDVKNHISSARYVMEKFESSSKVDRRAFSAYVLFKKR